MTTSKDPEEIRAEIERTRFQISNDVDEIGRTVSPSNVVQRQKDKARGALHGLKDKVMGSDDDDLGYGPSYDARRDQGSRFSGAGDRLHEAGDSLASARDSAGEAISNAPANLRRQTQGNPLAAGLIAFGVGWLAASLVPSSRQEQRLAEQAEAKAQPYLQEAQESAKGLVDDLKPAAQDAVAEVRATAEAGVESVKAEGQHAAANVKDGAVEAKDNVQAQRES